MCPDYEVRQEYESGHHETTKELNLSWNDAIDRLSPTTIAIHNFYFLRSEDCRFGRGQDPALLFAVSLHIHCAPNSVLKLSDSLPQTVTEVG